MRWRDPTNLSPYTLCRFRLGLLPPGVRSLERRVSPRCKAWFTASSNCAFSSPFGMFPWLFPQIPIDSGGVPIDGGETKPGDIEPSIGRDMTVEL